MRSLYLRNGGSRASRFSDRTGIMVDRLIRLIDWLAPVFDRIGRRSEAISAYESARAANPSDDRLDLNAKSRAMLKRPPIARACK